MLIAIASHNPQCDACVGRLNVLILEICFYKESLILHILEGYVIWLKPSDTLS